MPVIGFGVVVYHNHVSVSRCQASAVLLAQL